MVRKMKFDEVKDRRGTYCTQWDYVKDRFGKDDLLPFTISDMDLESPKEIVDALIKRINHRIFGYSRWNHDDFKNSIEGWYNRRFNFQIDKEWIVYSPSVIYAVSKFIEMKSEKGDGVLINTPGYDGFFKVIEDNDRKLLTSSLKKVKNSYEIDFDDFELKCREAKIFLLCSPHNPTGKVWTEEELKRMIEICKKYNVFIISDEIHMDIIYNGKHQPILSQAGDYIENIVLCTSASKTFNIPALCGSYLFITNQKDKDEFLRILKNRDALSSPSILAVIATITAYNECGYWVDELVKYTESNIKYVKEYLEKNNFKFLEILYEDVFWNIETIFSTEKIKFIDKRYYYYRVNRDDSIMKLTKEIKGKNIEEFKKKQENSYKVIYENIEKFTTTRKNNLSIGRILYLLLEKERWQVKIDGNIFVKEIDESIRFNFKRLKKEEVEVLLKKFKELLESKETRKINGMSLLDKFYWRNKVITLNLIRKIIKKKLFK